MCVFSMDLHILWQTDASHRAPQTASRATRAAARLPIRILYSLHSHVIVEIEAVEVIPGVVLEGLEVDAIPQEAPDATKPVDVLRALL